MKPKKSLGQNFLNNDKILNLIVENGKINKEDIVLEIGPGTGKLTKKIILKNPSKIIVVEKDKRFINILEKKFGSKIEIINEDFLDCYDKFKYSRPIKIFGNLPYNVSTKILTSLIKLDNFKKIFSLLIFVFQKEVAERIVAEHNTKHYGRLSILTSWKMYKSKIFDISPHNFYPIPKVWSSLILLQPKMKIENIKKSKNLEHITNVFFNQRRKMIKKPLNILFTNSKEVVNQLDLDINLRPQNLKKDTFYKICLIYEKLIK